MGRGARTRLTHVHDTQYSQYLRELFSLRYVDYFMRGTNILSFPKPCTTTYGLNSFTYTVAKFWNALPDRLRAISCLDDFIRAIRQHELTG